MSANVLKVYQLYIALCEISPDIWRRVWVHSGSTIADLYDTLQLAMGWTNSHINRFIIHGKVCGVSQIGALLSRRS